MSRKTTPCSHNSLKSLSTNNSEAIFRRLEPIFFSFGPNLAGFSGGKSLQKKSLLVKRLKIFFMIYGLYTYDGQGDRGTGGPSGRSGQAGRSSKTTFLFYVIDRHYLKYCVFSSLIREFLMENR